MGWPSHGSHLYGPNSYNSKHSHSHSWGHNSYNNHHRNQNIFWAGMGGQQKQYNKRMQFLQRQLQSSQDIA
eukprot:2657416-Karenia_brevis.AAC.1